MPDNDSLIKPASTPTLPSMPSLSSDIMTTPTQKSSFWKVLGGVAGVAGNIFAPGIGGVIGGMISRGSSSVGGSYSGTVAAQQMMSESDRTHIEMMQINSAMNSQQQRQNMDMLGQQQKNAMQLVGLQTQVGQQSQEFTTVSNLLKSRHDSEMTAVNNFKS